jgi:hypothetical protein
MLFPSARTSLRSPRGNSSSSHTFANVPPGENELADATSPLSPSARTTTTRVVDRRVIVIVLVGFEGIIGLRVARPIVVVVVVLAVARTALVVVVVVVVMVNIAISRRRRRPCSRRALSSCSVVVARLVLVDVVASWCRETKDIDDVITIEL